MTMKDLTKGLSRPDVCSDSDEKWTLGSLHKPCDFKEANRKNEGVLIYVSFFELRCSWTEVIY